MKLVFEVSDEAMAALRPFIVAAEVVGRKVREELEVHGQERRDVAGELVKRGLSFATAYRRIQEAQIKGKITSHTYLLTGTVEV